MRATDGAQSLPSLPHNRCSCYRFCFRESLRSGNCSIIGLMILPFLDKMPNIHPSAYIADSADIIGDVIVGKESSVWFNCVVRGDVFYIRIGERTNVQDGTVIHVANGRHATILEDHVSVGQVKLAIPFQSAVTVTPEFLWQKPNLRAGCATSFRRMCGAVNT